MELSLFWTALYIVVLAAFTAMSSSAGYQSSSTRR